MSGLEEHNVHPSKQPHDKTISNPRLEAKRQLAWIQECAHNHRCAKVIGTSFIPTRLIDVRHSLIRLINTKDLTASDKRYAALSYCWGNSMSENAKTTASSLSSRQLKIEVKTLPKTLREAIEVTKSLSIPFIWIDALCIIQDERSDWEHEIETMSQVYSCAFVTIAANVSPHCSGGFLNPKRPLLIPPPSSTQKSKTPDETWRAAFFTSPLFTRGWTLQERELSPRVLHFTTEMVVFECHYYIKRYSTSVPKLSLTMPKEITHSRFLKPDGWQYRIYDAESTRQRYVRAADLPLGRNWHKIWYETVAQFSRRKLTDEMDMLPAIAGLADAMEMSNKWNYVAGLWKENLSLDLLWQRRYDREIREGEGFVAPSWSWASLGGEVAWVHFELGLLADSVLEILDTSVQPAGSNAKGKLAGGFLRVKSRVKLLASKGEKIRTHEVRSMSDRLLMIYKGEGGDFSGNLWVYWDRESELEADGEVVICEVLRGDGRRRGAGLALRETDREGEFRRVGMVIYIKDGDFVGIQPTELIII